MANINKKLEELQKSLKESSERLGQLDMAIAQARQQVIALQGAIAVLNDLKKEEETSAVKEKPIEPQK